MSRTVKIGISLPRELLDAADRECRSRGESRSEFFRHAVESALRAESERAAVERYIEGYRRYPETDAEAAEWSTMSQAALAEEPWDEKG